MKLKAYAKINLSLDITGKRDDGYHDISSVMQSVTLCDEVEVLKNESGTISISSDSAEIPNNEENIAYKAAKLMIDTFNLSCGFDIFIKKNIPVAGGMAGGSTNAAAVIKAINEICKLGLTTDELMKIGVKVGADVPFCIYQKPALAEGIGEKITAISGLSDDLWILLVNPNEKVSTKKIYEKIDNEVLYNKADNEKLACALKNNDINTAKKYMINVMQDVSQKECGKIAEIIKKIDNLGAIHSMMSGSGATCFGIFNEKPDLIKTEKLFDGFFVSAVKAVN